MVENNSVEILLVEDNRNDVELTMRAFDKHHISGKVFVVGDGEEALDFIFCRGAYAGRPKNNMPKVIFLDLKLPKINGMEVLKAIKDDPVARFIPIVVLTSSIEEKDLLKCYELGVNSYLEKPVEFNSFEEAVAKAGLYWLLLNRPPYKN
jgi:two-component system response regulator